MVDKLASDVDKLRSQLAQAESSQQDAQQQLEEAITANKLLEVLLVYSITFRPHVTLHIHILNGFSNSILFLLGLMFTV